MPSPMRALVGAVTNAPPRAPTLMVTMPLASSPRNASRTVTRLTPNLLAQFPFGGQPVAGLERAVANQQSDLVDDHLRGPTGDHATEQVVCRRASRCCV